MSNTKPYLFGAVLGASAMYAALQYHVVHSHDGFQMVPRTPQHSVGLAYADVRNWSPSQWTDRPELARALMAHGSSDLISESVANSLADSVTEENSTLDQLRSFLDKSKQDGVNGSAGGLLEIPTSTGKPVELPSIPDDDLTRIPFPQDAKSKSAADPFRVAQSPVVLPDAAEDLPRPVGATRFSASDVIEGLREDVDGRIDSFTAYSTREPIPASSVPAAGQPTTAQQAQAMEDRIFGSSNSAGNSSATDQTSASGSMFEEVSTQLESRAQAALNRAKEAAANKAGSVLNGATSASDSYARRRIEEFTPESVKSIIKSSTADGTAQTDNTSQVTGSLLDQFDPFLE